MHMRPTQVVYYWNSLVTYNWNYNSYSIIMKTLYENTCYYWKGTLFKVKELFERI